MALLFTSLAIVQRTASVTALEFLMILPRWLALFALAAGLLFLLAAWLFRRRDLLWTE